jgi:hypothetical protein
MPSDPSGRETSEPVTDEVRSSVATVVQGFTAAELALRDVALAIERFRSAAEQLSEAREDQAAARLALLETAQMADRVAVQLSPVVESLRDTTSVLRAIDPDRLWSHLDKLESQQAATATVINDWIPTADRRLVELHEQQSATAGDMAAHLDKLESQQAATATVINDWIPTADRRLVKLHEQQSAAAAVMAARMAVVGAELGKIQSQQSAAAATLEAWMTRFWVEVEKVEREQGSAAFVLDSRMTALDRQTRRLAWLSGGALAAGLVGVAILVAIVAHFVAI